MIRNNVSAITPPLCSIECPDRVTARQLNLFAAIFALSSPPCPPRAGQASNANHPQRPALWSS